MTLFFFFFNDTATTEIYTLSLHDALPISVSVWGTGRSVLARCFSRQHRITHFAPTGSASDLRHMHGGFAYRTPYILTPGQPPPGLGYLPASHHRLPTTDSGHRLHHTHNPKVT